MCKHERVTCVVHTFKCKAYMQKGYIWRMNKFAFLRGLNFFFFDFDAQEKPSVLYYFIIYKNPTNQSQTDIICEWINCNK